MKNLDETKAAVLEAIEKLQDEPGAWVALSRLRNELGEAYHRHTVDEAIKSLEMDDDKTMARGEPNQRMLTQADHDSAMRFGNQWSHLIRLDL